MPIFTLKNGAVIAIHNGHKVEQHHLHNNYRIFDAEGGLYKNWTTFPPIAVNPVAKPEALEKTPVKPKPTQELKDIKIGDVYNYKALAKYQGLEGKLPIRADTTYVGVEVELEKVDYKSSIVGSWKVTEDGSLKDAGAEFVSVPIPFRYLEVELERLFASLSSKHASQRCSIHVHMNARDFTLLELKSFIALYMIFEKSMYNYSGDRWNNNFCVPLHFSPHIVRNFVKVLDDHKYIHEGWFKYFGFNLCPLYGGESSKIGTIEFRQMKGNTDIEYIINWINLIVSLKISAKKFSFDTIIGHLETMNTTSAYYWLAEEVFKDFSRLITGQPTFKKDVERCITMAKTVFLQIKPAVEDKGEV